jgi:hypothetical protein
VARLKRRIFNYIFSGAFLTNHFPRQCLWCFSASHWRTLLCSVLLPFWNAFGRGESCPPCITAQDINEEERQPQFLGISPAVSRRERHIRCFMTPLLSPRLSTMHTWSPIQLEGLLELPYWKVTKLNSKKWRDWTRSSKRRIKCQCMARCGATEIVALLVTVQATVSDCSASTTW